MQLVVFATHTLQVLHYELILLSGSVVLLISKTEERGEGGGVSQFSGPTPTHCFECSITCVK